MAKEFKLPNLGEGVAQGEVVGVIAKVGAAITKGEPMFEVETDKAVADVAAPENGTVVSINVKVGDKVKPGHVMVTYEAGGAAAAPAPAPAATKSNGEVKPAAAAAPAPAAKAAPAAPPPAPAPTAEKTSAAPAATGSLVAASPGVRKFARELGVDLTAVPGTGGGGRVLETDVKEYVKRVLAGGGASAGGGAGLAQPKMPDFARWGAVERVPLKGVRKATAEGMSRSWGLVPHVTQFDLVDITATEESRKKLADKRKASGQPGKITMTILAIKAVTKALGEFPQFASSLDATAGEGGEVIRKSYRHIGIAVDSPNGLMVPVVRDTDKKSLSELAVEVEALAEKVRSRKIQLEEMQGSVFSISNLGGIAGTVFTPIVNWPEVAILGISKSRQELQLVDGRVEPRLVMGLSLSYDHRVIDGADGARFIKRLGELLSDPFDLLT
ncbi:MAG TPA: dihydrolipoamide acetyltransferase family protein [Polyangia bacterium]|nr:dihydrolipoamide acetyltransferase family protein [Polyangia bacterium]